MNKRPKSLIIFCKINNLGITDVMPSLNYTTGKNPATAASSKERCELASGDAPTLTAVQL